MIQAKKNFNQYIVDGQTLKYRTRKIYSHDDMNVYVNFYVLHVLMV